MTDLNVEKLRFLANGQRFNKSTVEYLNQIADRIEELEAALRDAEATIEAMNGNWIAPSQALGKGRYE